MTCIVKEVLGTPARSCCPDELRQVSICPQTAVWNRASRKIAYLALPLIRRGDIWAADGIISRAILAPEDLPGDLALAAAIRAWQQADDFSRWYPIFTRLTIPVPQWYLTAAREAEVGGHLDKAEALYRQAVTLTPGNAQAHSALANFLEFYRHDIPGAIVEREAVVRLDPGPENMLGLAARYGYAGRFPEAVQLLDQVQARFPGYDEPLAFERGRIALEQRDPAQALRILEPVSEKYADSARIWDVLAQAFEAAGRTEEALRAARQAILVDPKYTWAYLVTARVLLTEDRSAEAEVYLQKLLVLGRGDRMEVLALISLGDTYVQLGSSELARQSFCRAQKLNYWGVSCEYIRQQIERLGGC